MTTQAKAAWDNINRVLVSVIAALVVLTFTKINSLEVSAASREARIDNLSVQLARVSQTQDSLRQSLQEVLVRLAEIDSPRSPKDGVKANGK